MNIFTCRHASFKSARFPIFKGLGEKPSGSVLVSALKRIWHQFLVSWTEFAPFQVFSMKKPLDSSVIFFNMIDLFNYWAENLDL